MYVGKKCAVEGWTRVWANELGNRQITVNCIAPGMSNLNEQLKLASTRLLTQTAN